MADTVFCLGCKHYWLENWMCCDAYPNGIPYDIRAGSVIHDKPYKEDNGIQFEPVDKNNSVKIRI